MSSNINTDETQNCIRAAADALFKFRQAIGTAVQNFFPEYASEANLEQIGRDRNAPRYNNENLEDYRARVQDAFGFNRGIGKVDDIKRVMTSLGYSFNSFIQNDNTGGEGFYNIVILTTGSNFFDGDSNFDGALFFNTPQRNDINIEIITASPILDAEKARIRAALNPIIRASSTIYNIVQVTP